MAASSSAFVKERDVLSQFQGWIRDLDAEQTAVATKEKAIARQDSAQVIARALVRYGITINSGVQGAIDAMQKQQDRIGDSFDLATIMSHLPQQWSAYRIMLQKNGRAYFQKHSHETPNFMKLYFHSITFLTLWNDVWVEHVGLLGGRQLNLLKSIQQWLLELDKPSARQAAAEEQAELWKPPSQTLKFNSTDLRDIAAAAEEAVKAQELHQAETLKQLKEAVGETRKLHIWFSQTYPEALGAAERPDNVPGEFIMKDGRDQPVEELKRAIRWWCKKILDREHLYDSNWIQQLIAGVIKKRDEHWTLFEQLFQINDWREAYKKYILADIRWTRALRLHTFIEKMQTDELAPAVIKQIANHTAQTFTAAHVNQLKQESDETQRHFLEVQQPLMTEVAFHDTTRYQLWVLQTCAALAGKNDGHQQIKSYLAANSNQNSDAPTTTPIDKAIGRDAHAIYQPENLNMFCKALLKVKGEKESLRANIHRERQLGQVDKADQTAQNAATACTGIAEAIAELASKEKSDQRKNIVAALKQKPIAPTLLPLELFDRPLASVYAKEGRRRLLPIFSFIQSKNILFSLSTEKVDKDDPATSVMPWTTSEMIPMATATDSSTFGHFIRYALWLIWVMHQDTVGNFTIPLTSDPRSAQ